MLCSIPGREIQATTHVMADCGIITTNFLDGTSVLGHLTEEVRECLASAAEAREKADGIPDPSTKADFLKMERHGFSSLEALHSQAA